MRLREQLDKLGQMKGITQDEKGGSSYVQLLKLKVLYMFTDPEEFLNLMLKHTLHATPFVSIRY